MFNIFNYLLSGLLSFLQYMVLPLFLDAIAFAGGGQIDEMTRHYAMAAMDIVYPFITVFDMTIPVIVIGIFVVITLIKFGINVYHMIKNFIPMAG